MTNGFPRAASSLLVLLALFDVRADEPLAHAPKASLNHSRFSSTDSASLAGIQTIFRLPATKLDDTRRSEIDEFYTSEPFTDLSNARANPFIESFSHTPSYTLPLHFIDPQRSYTFAALARGFYVNDQRIEWSGQEATFGAEGALFGSIHHQGNGWQTSAQCELFLNQQFDPNILVDTPERASYRANFDIDPFEISQLLLSARNGDFLISLGKLTTPFGRAYFPLHQNNRQDAPFIRTESILWRETGLVLQFDPSVFVFTAAIVNGSEDGDTNSSKALISRVGIDTECFAVGASIKWQDGIGSENQKQINNHIGADVMFRRGPFTLSAEVIYDEYGFRRNFNPNNITWGRSIYYRDQFIGLNQPISGLGYYVNLDMTLGRWSWVFNYGEFNPETIGDLRHDITTRRGIVKSILQLGPHFKSYTMVLMENNVPGAQDGRLRRGIDILSGFQFEL